MRDFCFGQQEWNGVHELVYPRLAANSTSKYSSVYTDTLLPTRDGRYFSVVLHISMLCSTLFRAGSTLVLLWKEMF